METSLTSLHLLTYKQASRNRVPEREGTRGKTAATHRNPTLTCTRTGGQGKGGERTPHGRGRRRKRFLEGPSVRHVVTHIHTLREREPTGKRDGDGAAPVPGIKESSVALSAGARPGRRVAVFRCRLFSRCRR